MLPTFLVFLAVAALSFTAGALAVAHTRDRNAARLTFKLAARNRRIRELQHRVNQLSRGPFYLTPARVDDEDGRDA